MNRRNCPAALLFALLVLPFGVFAQKAFEIIKYSGKTEAFEFRLDFADGYPEASALKIVNLKTKEKLSLSSADSDKEGQMKFTNDSTPEQYVVLAMDPYEAPETISGTYFNNGVKYAIELARKK